MHAAILESMQDIKDGYLMNQHAGFRRKEVICNILAPCPQGVGSSSRLQGFCWMRDYFGW